MPVQPSDEIYAFSVTIPAATPKTAPIVIPTPIPARSVNEIQVVIPPGPSGTVGFQIGMANTPILPRNPGGFFVSDNEKISWPVTRQNDSGAWQVLGYNTDINDHTIEVRYLTSLIVGGTAGPATTTPGSGSQAPHAVQAPTALRVTALSAPASLSEPHKGTPARLPAASAARPMVATSKPPPKRHAVKLTGERPAWIAAATEAMYRNGDEPVT